MIKKYCLIIWFLLIQFETAYSRSGQVHLNKIESSQFSDFLNSIEGEFPINIGYLKLVSSKIYLAGPSWAERHGYINQTAAASYNSILRTLVLKEELLVRAPGLLRVATLNEMRARLGDAYQSKIRIILHELAHAEYDRVFFTSKSKSDLRLQKLFKNEIPNWLDRAYPDLGYFKKKYALSEIFAYIREGIFELFNNEALVIFSYNGYNPYKKSCSFNQTLRNRIANLPLEEFIQFSLPESYYALPYRDRVTESTIFVSGQDISLQDTIIGDFPKLYFEAMWDQFAEQYQAPQDYLDLVKKMNSQSSEISYFKQCRTEFWKSLHN